MNNSLPIVCQLLHSLTVGGAEVLAARLGRFLRERYRFIFVCLDDLGPLGEELQADGFPVRTLDRGDGIDWSCARRLSRLLKDESVDLVHAHQYTPFVYAALARLPFGRKPIVFTEHGRFHPDTPSRKRAVFNNVVLSRRDRIAAVGESVREALVTNEGLPRRRIEVVYNGIDLTPFETESASSSSEVRREFGLTDQTFLTGQVARLDSIKDHPTAVRTIAKLVEAGEDVHLLIVGEGPHRPAIEAEIARTGMEKHVTLAGLRRDVPRLLDAVDALMLTSVSEGIPLTIIEAMAAGRPVVCTDVGGLSEVVTAGETGFLAPAGDETALADRLIRLISNHELCQQIGTAGRAVAFDKFSETRMAEAYANLYDECLNRLSTKS